MLAGLHISGLIQIAFDIHICAVIAVGALILIFHIPQVLRIDGRIKLNTDRGLVNAFHKRDLICLNYCGKLSALIEHRAGCLFLRFPSALIGSILYDFLLLADLRYPVLHILIGFCSFFAGLQCALSRLKQCL